MDVVAKSGLNTELIALSNKSLEVIGAGLRWHYANPKDNFLMPDLSEYLRRLDAAETIAWNR